MYAIRQIYDHAQDVVPVPENMRHQRIEVIFMTLEDEPAASTGTLAQALAHPASADIDFEPVTLELGLKKAEF